MDGLLFALAAVSLCVAAFALWRWRAASREAATDSLTRLPNRRGGRDALEREVLRAGRYGRPLSIIMFDLDRFKAINDRFGHATGDRVLRSVARAAAQGVRETDVLARWGGEEFLVVCAETDLEEAGRLAERLRRRIAHLHGAPQRQVTASFGVAALASGEDAGSLLERVDRALYGAKHAGRNRVVSLSAKPQRLPRLTRARA